MGVKGGLKVVCRGEAVKMQLLCFYFCCKKQLEAEGGPRNHWAELRQEGLTHFLCEL